MLHDGHQLNGVIAEILDPRQHVLGELLVRRDSGLGRRNADVCLVDPQALGLLGPRMLKAVLLVRGRVPEDGVVGWRDAEVLYDPLDPCWDAIDTFAAGEHHCDLFGVGLVSVLIDDSNGSVGSDLP